MTTWIQSDVILSFCFMVWFIVFLWCCRLTPEPSIDWASTLPKATYPEQVQPIFAAMFLGPLLIVNFNRDLCLHERSSNSFALWKCFTPPLPKQVFRSFTIQLPVSLSPMKSKDGGTHTTLRIPEAVCVHPFSWVMGFTCVLGLGFFLKASKLK